MGGVEGGTSARHLPGGYSPQWGMGPEAFRGNFLPLRAWAGSSDLERDGKGDVGVQDLGLPYATSGHHLGACLPLLSNGTPIQVGVCPLRQAQHR